MNQKELKITYSIYSALSTLDESTQSLCQSATEALSGSYAPYSSFNVGTAVLLDNGTVVKGSNQENVAYPSGLCAERVALFSIGTMYPEAVIKTMAITAKTSKFQITTPVTSCGACLQVMAEFEQKQKRPIKVVFYCIGGEIIVVESVKDLMPFSFVEDRLGH